MTWNYRVVEDENGLWIREVYYDSTGVPRSCTEFPSAPYGDDVHELVRDIAMMIRGTRLPVLQYSDFEDMEEKSEEIEEECIDKESQL